MLRSPSHAVIGTTDPEAMERFLGLFGFQLERRARLPRDAAGVLYGLDGDAQESRLAVPGAAQGWIRLVETSLLAPMPGPFDARPLSIDLYTRDIVESLAIVERAGFLGGAQVELQIDASPRKMVEIQGPDRLKVVLVEADRRHPSVLDHDSERLVSELHSIVWAVSSTEEALPFWTESAGLEVLIDTKIEGPEISELLDLPRKEVALRYALLCGSGAQPGRFELLEFIDDPGGVRSTWPLAAGLHAPAFSLESLSDAVLRLGGIEPGPRVELDTAVHPHAQAVTAVAPGGVRFELWQEDEPRQDDD